MPAKYVLLFRPLHMHDLERAGLVDGAKYVYSQWEGYWQQDSCTFLREWVEKHKMHKESVHTSGHAGVRDLKRFAEALNPAKIVPIHTFMPEKYAEFFKNVQIYNDGEYWEV
jgi:ribonuclease J